MAKEKESRHTTGNGTPNTPLHKGAICESPQSDGIYKSPFTTKKAPKDSAGSKGY